MMVNISPIQIRNGPVKERHCTDMICIIFIPLILALALALSLNGQLTTDLSILGLPLDSTKFVCGVKQLSQYKYLYIPEKLDSSVCVISCPSDQQTSTCYHNDQFLKCPKGIPTESNDQKICLPTQNDPLRQKIVQKISKIKGSLAIDLDRSFIFILEGISLQIAIGIAFLLGLLVWPALFLPLFVVLGVSLMFCLSVGFLFALLGSKSEFVDKEPQNNTLFYALASAGFAILAFFMCFYIFQKRSKLNQAKYYADIGASYSRRNLLIIFSNLFFTVIVIILLFLLNKLLINSIFIDSSKQLFIKSVQLKQYWGLRLFMISLIFLWIRGVIISCSGFICSADTVFWYYSENPDSWSANCFQSLKNAFVLLFRYHIGTATYAGLTVANLPSRLLSWSNKLFIEIEKDRMSGTSSGLESCCYFSCFPYRLLSSLSQYYHIQTILQNLPMGQASQQASQLIQRNKSSFRALYTMGVFLNTISKLNLVTVCSAGTYFLMAAFTNNNLSSEKFLGPLILALLAGQAISQILLQPIVMASQVLINLYTIDLQIERNHYGHQNPHSCLQVLKDIIAQSKNNE